MYLNIKSAHFSAGSPTTTGPTAGWVAEPTNTASSLVTFGACAAAGFASSSRPAAAGVRPPLRFFVTYFALLVIGAALYTIAARYGAKALTIATISDCLITHEQLSANDREASLVEMVTLALETLG